MLEESFFTISERNGNLLVVSSMRSRWLRKDGVLRGDGVLVVQLQRADESGFELGKKMKRSSQESHMAADRFTAGQAADGLVDDRLENGGGKILFGSTLVDQGLDIGFCENAAAGGNGVKSFIIFRVFIQAGSVRLKEEAIWSMKEPVPPAQMPFIRCSTFPPSNK